MLIEVHALARGAEPNGVNTTCQKQSIVPLVVVEVIVTRDAIITGDLGGETRNREVPKGLARQPGKRWENIDSTLIVGFSGGPVESDFGGIQQGGREDMRLFQSEVLVARALFGEDDGRRGDHLSLDVTIVECVATEQGIPVGEALVDPALREIFVGRLGACEQVLRRAAPEIAAVRKGKERVNQLRHGSVGDALPRGRIGDIGDAADAETLNQRFKSAEVESFVAANGSPGRGSELVAAESRDITREGIEKILSVERGVTQELEGGAVEGIRAGTGDSVYDPAGGTAELRRIGIREHLKLQDCLDAEQHATHRSGGLVVDVVDVSAVQQEAALLRTRAVNRDLG